MTRDEVRAIWQEELGLADIDDADDFFDIGGHSLIMTVIQERLQKEAGVEIPMDVLFRRPTIGLVAEYIDARLVGQPSGN